MVGGTIRFIRQKLAASDWLAPILLCMAVSALLLGPAMKPGFIFLLDMPWPQHFQFSDFKGSHSAQVPLVAVLTFLNTFFAAWLLQKVVLILCITVAGVGMYRLQLFRRARRPGRYAAALVYMCNPFVLERLLAGQWLVLLGYALAPVFVLAMLRFGREPSRRLAWRLAVLFALYPVISLHWWYMVTLVSLPIALYWLRQRIRANKRRWQPSRQAVYLGLIALCLMVALNYRWLSVIGRSDSTLQRITPADFRAFATAGEGLFGSIINVLGLYGFWQTTASLPRELQGNALVYPAILIALTSAGAWWLYKKKGKIQLYVLIVGVVAVVLASGFGSPLTQPVTSVLIRIIPGYVGMRDTAKWVGIIAFVYAWYAPAGLTVLRQELRKIWQQLASPKLAAGLFVGAYCLLMLPGFWGINGQLQSYWYPHGWAEADTLMQVRGAQKAVILPWRGYLTLNFAGNAYVANPARLYFTPQVEQGRSANNVLIDTEASKSEYDRIAMVLFSGNVESALALYRQQGVDHLVLLKTADWQTYGIHLQGLKPLFEDSSIAVYDL